MTVACESLGISRHEGDTAQLPPSKWLVARQKVAEMRFRAGGSDHDSVGIARPAHKSAKMQLNTPSRLSGFDDSRKRFSTDFLEGERQTRTDRNLS